MKYITINEHGDVTGMYLDSPGGGAVALSDEDWTRVGPGYRYVDGALVAPEPTAPSPVDPVPVLVSALQGLMDAKARTYGYDDLKTAITYRGDPNPRFAAEAEGFFVWRSGVWTTAYAHLARVKAGEATFPTLDEAIAMMPPLTITYP